MNDIIKISVPDKHIRLVWKGINEALVYSDSNTSDISSASDILTCVKWLSSMQDPILRYLAIQSYHIFESTQHIKEIDLDGILSKSKEYRAILEECEEQLLIEIHKLENGEFYDEEKHSFVTVHCNIIRDYQMIWHLAEIFFIKLSSPGYFMHDLQNWLHLQQPHVGANYGSLIDEYNSVQGDIDIGANDSYWPTVWSLALHGRKSELLNLLACHTHANSTGFRTMRDTLGQMPLFDSSFVKCTIEFDFAWTQWRRAATSSLLDSGVLSPYAGLEKLARIILGCEDVFYEAPLVELVEGCWFFAVVPFLRFSQPLADAKTVAGRFGTFKRSFQKATSSGGSTEDTTGTLCSERILAAIDSAFRMDLGEFVGHMSRNSNDWWLCAHLVDLIEKINPQLFPAPLAQDPVAGGDGIFDERLARSQLPSIRESFVVQYASGFVSHPSLVLTALNYLHLCPVTGRAHVAQIIDHLSMPTDRFATTMHNWCLERNYDSVAASICRRRCVAAFKANEMGNSLSWAIRGNDVHFISRIADKLLRDLFDCDRLRDGLATSSAGLIDSLAGLSFGVVVGKKMTFLIRFAEVQALMAANQMAQAAPLLINLVESKLVSRHFNLDILQAVRPLIASRGLFKTNDIYLLMQMLLENETGDGFAAEVKELQELLVNEISHACLVQA